MKNITFILALFLLLCGCSKEKTNGIEARTVTNTDFADPLLYIYMQNKYDTNKDYIFQPEEVMAVTSVDLSKKNNFASLKGLELFVNVEVLNLAGQRPTDKNLKLTNPKLWSLNCSDMALRSLDVTGLSELTELDCSENYYLEELDLSKNAKLKELNCESIKTMSTLDLSNNPELEKMSCKSNSIREIDLTNCKKVTSINCSSSNLSSIDLNDCIILEYLNIFSSRIKTLNIEKCTALKYLDVRVMDFNLLNISNNSLLEEIYLYIDKDTPLDITNNHNIKTITLDDYRVSENTYIIYIKKEQIKPQIIKNRDYISYEFQYK